MTKGGQITFNQLCDLKNHSISYFIQRIRKKWLTERVDVQVLKMEEKLFSACTQLN